MTSDRDLNTLSLLEYLMPRSQYGFVGWNCHLTEKSLVNSNNKLFLSEYRGQSDFESWFAFFMRQMDMCLDSERTTGTPSTSVSSFLLGMLTEECNIQPADRSCWQPNHSQFCKNGPLWTSTSLKYDQVFWLKQGFAIGLRAYDSVMIRFATFGPTRWRRMIRTTRYMLAARFLAHISVYVVRKETNGIRKHQGSTSSTRSVPGFVTWPSVRKWTLLDDLAQFFQ